MDFIIDYMKKNVSKNMLWIDTKGLGAALADYLENKGILINRFSFSNEVERKVEKLPEGIKRINYDPCNSLEDIKTEKIVNPCCTNDGSCERTGLFFKLRNSRGLG